MDSIGFQLKNARVRRGLSIEEVSKTTRIPIRSLHAIENDDLGSMDSAFFYRSFVRQFAQCVHLDHLALAELLGAASEQIPEPLVPGQDGARSRPDVPGLRPKRHHKLRWVLSVASLAVMLGACSSFYEFWERSRTVPDPSGSVHAPGKGSEPETSQPRAAAEKSESAPSVPEATAEAFRIKLSAVENTWLSLAADGKEVFKGTLRADETRTLEGYQTARVRTGNAGGLEVVFNGRSLGKLGPEGQMRTVVFTKDSYNVLQPRLSLPLATIIPVRE